MTKRKFMLVGFLVTSAVLVAGCEQPNSEQTQRYLPEKGFVANSQQGERLFRDNCAQCHGKAGAGTNQGPPLVHKIYHPGHHADLTFYLAAKNGTQQHHWRFGNMPPVPAVSPEQVGHIIAYVRRQQRQAGIH